MTTSRETTLRLDLARALDARPGGAAAAPVALRRRLMRVTPIRARMAALAPPALRLVEVHRSSLL